MTMDSREAILARLVVVAGTVEGIANTFRNQIALNEEDLPAISVLDGDEKADDTDPGGRGPKAPRRMIMMPQMLIYLPKNASLIGTSLNRFRALLVDAVANDDVLTAMTINNHGARLMATQTALAWGRSMLGEMGVSFAIPYVAFPGQLSA